MSQMEKNLTSSSLPFIESMYAAYLEDPNQVSEDWREYFSSLGTSERAVDNSRRFRIGPSFEPAGLFGAGLANGHGNGNGNGAAAPVSASDMKAMRLATLQDRVDQLVRAFRVRGHIVATVNPLGLPRPKVPELDPEHYGFTQSDYDQVFSTRTIGGPNVLTLRGIIDRLRNTYCRTIGVQFMHMDNFEERHWLQERMEASQNRLQISRRDQFRIFTRLVDAVMFEEFIQKKFVGAKSFSLEGAESLIPLLDMAIEKSGRQHIDEIVLGMAHRGRLNVLANIMGKSPRKIFREFEDLDSQYQRGRGDVKYHLGYSNNWVTANHHNVHLSLCFNPSHLEFVNPVAQGRMRAKQDRIDDTDRKRGMVLLIHGDAAFAGEGIVQETLNLSELKGYKVGGTIHVIVNNQIGFTTPPEHGRSCHYATDVAKMLQIPIFHVNGEDPEAVAQVIELAMDFRHQFQRDVVIDMYCYRLRGHNEGDDPSFTQPGLYRIISHQPPVAECYLEHLILLGEITAEDADKLRAARRQHLEHELSQAFDDDLAREPEMRSRVWTDYIGGLDIDTPDVDTGVPVEKLTQVLDQISTLPETFHPHRNIDRLVKLRKEMALGNKPLDWSAAETLAFATLSLDGIRTRLSGQDSERGTFSHRHLVLHDIENSSLYVPVHHLSPDQARIEVYNSPLSEAGVLGFDYGYSLDSPNTLIIWEAQFGDFVNAAQVIIDQFIASAEDKWRRLSGLVLLLPHGFEGMGPEHSSARPERFLSLAAEDNMQIVNATTPAQFFHLLRRQTMRKYRKPLVVMTPKSLLRNPKAVSSLEELSYGTFQRVLHDNHLPDPSKCRRILLCTGKIYYELEECRRVQERDDVAIVRLEQLYPLREDKLAEAFAPFPAETPVVWVQEEPENMGAWRFLRVRYCHNLLGHPFDGISRRASSSPATGSPGSHKVEQQEIIDAAFRLD